MSTAFLTTITGSATPAVTTYTTVADGHMQEDVLISIPNDLIDRMTEFIRMSTDCPGGTAFDTIAAKRSDNFGEILCGAEGLIVNSVPGAPFADFRLLEVQPLPFTNADALRAMNAAMAFARGLAPLLQVTTGRAALVGVGAFAVSWMVWNNPQPLDSQNIIPAAALAGTITSPPTLSETSTATCSVCFASCRYVGPIQNCVTECSDATSCTSSIATDVDDGGEEVTTTATVAYTDYGDDTTDSTDTTSATETVVPFQPGGPFSLSIPAASTTPTPAPTPTPTSISTPSPTLGPQQCNDANSYAGHKDIHESQVTGWLNSVVCTIDQTFDSTSPPLDWNPVMIGGAKDIYHYRISWIPGCQTTANTQNKIKPLEGSSCYSLFYEDYKNCLNGGVGGWRDVGCLRYEQNPSTSS